MKRFLYSLIVLAIASGVSAQRIIQKGYYRVQNFQTGRYIIMVDNKSEGLSINAGSFDILALRTTTPFSKIVNDPACVYYIECVSQSENLYNLIGQGTDAYQATG